MAELLDRNLTGMPSSAPQYRRIAPFYDLLELPFEYGRYRRLRRLVFNGLSGRILDAGIGTGRNMEFYPRGAQIVGIDLSPAMLARARRRLGNSPATTVELRGMDIARLDFPANSFDAAVATFVFCVLSDDLQLPALRELCRVVRAGGTVRLLEYVRPRRPLRRAIARLWERWIAWAYGAGFNRRTEECIPEAGLELVTADFVVDELVKLLTARVPKWVGTSGSSLPGWVARGSASWKRRETCARALTRVPRQKNWTAAMIQPGEVKRIGERVTLAALFVGFLKVSLLGFGGGLVWARRIVVDQKRWLDDHDFAEILTLCQLMPGPNIVGITLCVGSKLRGPLGAVSAVAGFILLPWTVGLSFGGLLLHYAHLPVLQHILGGLSAAAAGLMIATGIRLLMPHRNRRTALVFAALAFIGMALVKLPLLLVLLGLAPVSIALAGIASARAS